MSFMFSALEAEQFREILSLPNDQLATHNAIEIIAEENGTLPCRVSLRNACKGEAVLLLNYEHLSVASPYRSRHAIYVRRAAETAAPAIDEIPDILRGWPLSIRAFDRHDMMISAEVIDDSALKVRIDEILVNNETDYIHIHFAGAGCYAARVDRVT
ncbi:MAG: DUF1203 domain-containing protein [Pseudomonadota bacterium]